MLSIRPEATIAVLIGISEFPQDPALLPALPAVRNNVLDFAKLLADPTLIGVPSKNIFTVLDEPNASDISTRLARKARTAADTLLVYYSGHGIIGQTSLHLHLAVRDTTQEDAETNGIPIEHVRRAINNSGAKKKIFILDCCFSGRGIVSMSGEPSTLLSSLEIEGTYAISSAPANHPAMAPKGEKYTTFTGELFRVIESGLPNGKEGISLEEIYEYIRREFRKRPGTPDPQQVRHQDADKLVFCRNRHPRRWTNEPGGLDDTIRPLPPRQIPSLPHDFTGREQEVNALATEIRLHRVAICVVWGMGGIGKTAVALKLAEELGNDYTDQIYLDLKGVSQSSLSPSAREHVIRAYLPDRLMPDTEAEMAELYWSVLTGKRAFLLMDNARDANQVKPLIPPEGCVLIVTSRKHIASRSLRARGLFSKNLEVLPADDACSLLLKIEPRIGKHADALANLCGYFPIALQSAGSQIKDDLEPDVFVPRLRNERTRLQLIKGDDEDDDLDVVASFNLSYDSLDPDAALAFRQLAVFPGSFDSLAEEEICQDPSHAHLSALVPKSLVQYRPESKRYLLHDLVRVFAANKLNEGERAQAERRHAFHYLTILAKASDLYRRGGNSIAEGLALFNQEWTNMQAGQTWASGHFGDDDETAELCSDYAGSGIYILGLRQDPSHRVRWLKAALRASKKLGDTHAEGRHLGSLGYTYDSVGKYRLAMKHLARSLSIARKIKDRQGEGQSLGNLGNAYKNLGQYGRALEHHEESLAIAREIGNPWDEGAALGNLGNTYHALGEYRQTIEYQKQRLAIVRKVGDRRGEGQSLGNLGKAHAYLGEYTRAIEYHEQSLDIAKEIGDRQGKAQALGNLGFAYQAMGEPRRALEYHEKQLTIAREIGDRRAEANAQGNLGRACHSLGDYPQSIEYQEQSLAIDKDIGDREGEADALWNMSLSKEQLEKRSEAISDAEASLIIYDAIHSPSAEGVRSRLDEWKSS